MKSNNVGSLLLKAWMKANNLTKDQFQERLKASRHRGTAHQIIFAETGIKSALFNEPVPQVYDLDRFVAEHLKTTDKEVNDLVDDFVGVDGWGHARVIGGSSR